MTLPFSSGSTRMTKEIVESAKVLLGFMGIPYINAPSEGEAQASYMCKKGLVYAAASQDYDTMLFGSLKVVRNLTISGKRKLPRKNIYVNVEPELMSFDDTLKNLGVNQRQLIWIGILLGTDFNKGITGIGPKTALKVAKASKSIEDIEKYVKERGKEQFELDPREVEKLFLEPEVDDIGKDKLHSIMDTRPNTENTMDFMCKKHDFSEDRIGKYAEKLSESRSASRQRSIDGWV